jgi:hypothetical protein
MHVPPVSKWKSSLQLSHCSGVVTSIVQVELVGVVEAQRGGDLRTATWKGGALLSVLDSSRDGWVLREHWVRDLESQPGLVVGSISIAPNPHAQLFYYCRAQQGCK